MINPLKDRLLIKRDAPEVNTGVIQYTFEEKPNQGTVVNAGPDVKDVKVGDKVMFGKYDGSTIKYGGEELIIMSETVIWGVLE